MLRIFEFSVMFELELVWFEVVCVSFGDGAWERGQIEKRHMERGQTMDGQSTNHNLLKT